MDVKLNGQEDGDECVEEEEGDWGGGGGGDWRRSEMLERMVMMKDVWGENEKKR